MFVFVVCLFLEDCRGGLVSILAEIHINGWKDVKYEVRKWTVLSYRSTLFVWLLFNLTDWFSCFFKISEKV